MSLSRKHYEAVAGIIFDAVAVEDHDDKVWNGRQDAIHEIASTVAGYFASDNPAFDRQRFLKACGVEA